MPYIALKFPIIEATLYWVQTNLVLIRLTFKKLLRHLRNVNTWQYDSFTFLFAQTELWELYSRAWVALAVVLVPVRPALGWALFLLIVWGPEGDLDAAHICTAVECSTVAAGRNLWDGLKMLGHCYVRRGTVHTVCHRPWILGFPVLSMFKQTTASLPIQTDHAVDFSICVCCLGKPPLWKTQVRNLQILSQKRYLLFLTLSFCFPGLGWYKEILHWFIVMFHSMWTWHQSVTTHVSKLRLPFFHLSWATSKISNDLTQQVKSEYVPK